MYVRTFVYCVCSLLLRNALFLRNFNAHGMPQCSLPMLRMHVYLFAPILCKQCVSLYSVRDTDMYVRTFVYCVRSLLAALNSWRLGRSYKDFFVKSENSNCALINLARFYTFS